VAVHQVVVVSNHSWKQTLVVRCWVVVHDLVVHDWVHDFVHHSLH